MELLVLRLVSLVAIALVYMLFDLFNKRNIPELFAYGSVAYGLLLTVLYLNASAIAFSVVIATVVLGLGYLVYRAGYLGAGDVFEFAALSLILPFQAVPLLFNIPQFGIPFIVSVFMGGGIAALVAVPLYYIPRAKVRGMRIGKEIGRKDLLKALAVGAVYLVFAAFLIFEVGVGVAGIALLILMMLGSVSVVLFEKPITMSMVKYLNYKGIEEGDMIAINLMTRSAIDRMRAKVKGFDRLATKRLIGQLRGKRITLKIPVYKNAIPLAAPIFVGVVASILLGNVILLLLVPV